MNTHSRVSQKLLSQVQFNCQNKLLSVVDAFLSNEQLEKLIDTLDSIISFD
jgi:hypothetical protein